MMKKVICKIVHFITKKNICLGYCDSKKNK